MVSVCGCDYLTGVVRNRSRWGVLLFIFLIRTERVRQLFASHQFLRTSWDGLVDNVSSFEKEILEIEWAKFLVQSYRLPSTDYKIFVQNQKTSKYANKGELRGLKRNVSIDCFKVPPSRVSRVKFWKDSKNNVYLINSSLSPTSHSP